MQAYRRVSFSFCQPAFVVYYVCRCGGGAGEYFSMISETQFYVVDVGDDVSMECSFHADRYSMFDHPVLWRKRQLDESSQINILGSINDPFIQTNRYEVTFAAAEPRYELQLRISGQVALSRSIQLGLRARLSQGFTSRSAQNRSFRRCSSQPVSWRSTDPCPPCYLPSACFICIHIYSSLKSTV